MSKKQINQDSVEHTAEQWVNIALEHVKYKRNMNRKIDKSKLKLIKRKNAYDGYTMTNIKEVLDPKAFAEFEEWIFGQTVGVYKGQKLVYEHDFERFLRGLPVLD